MTRLSPHSVALLTAALMAGIFLMAQALPLPLCAQALAAAVLAYGLARVVLRLLVYRRLRAIEQMIREAMAARDLSTRWMGADPVQNIRQGIQELLAASQRELNQLKQLEHFRREFIGDVSHELKTPLFAIQGYVETLLDGAINDRNVNLKFLKSALKNTTRLNNLVQDLLVISRLETGELRMQPEAFRIYELVLDVADQLEAKLHNKGRNVHLHVHAHGNESLLVLADRNRIQQVLTNLVDNAIIYGRPDGNVDVEIVAEDEKARVVVRDDGYGIGEEHLPHLFSRFYRVDKSRSREAGGTGLGLAIVKNLVEAHGEHILVDSRPGQGTSFEFTLPRTR